MRLFLFCICIGVCASLHSQIPFHKKASLEDGLYISFNELRRNQPSISLESITNFDYILNAEKNVLILGEATEKELQKRSLTNIWGLSVDGAAYIRTQDKENERFYYVRLHIMGKISYYYYKAFRDKKVTMYVHNPYSGEQIGQKDIINKEQVSIKRMLHFYTGESTDFSHANLIAWTKDDLGLNKSIKALKTEELNEKLFKSLLIYNDRNKVFFKN